MPNPTPVKIRGAILDTAKTIINGSRQDAYGNPENNFTKIAMFWGTYKGVLFSPHDVAVMMSLLKIARISTGSDSEDSYVDTLGYMALAHDLKKEEV